MTTTKLTGYTVTTDQIIALEQAAFAAKDEDLIDICQAALQERRNGAGSAAASACAEAINDGRLNETVHCECGEWSGETCQWTGPRSETVIVRYMPAHLRASHVACGHVGLYPYNGTQLIRVERSCAARMLETDGQWCTIKVTPHVA